MAATRPTSEHRHVGIDDRPILLQTGLPGESPGARRPRSRTLLGSSAAAVLTIAILVAGSWSVWALVGTTAPPGKPVAPLWFSPPAPETSTEDFWMRPTVTSTEDKPAHHQRTEEEVEAHPHVTGSTPTTTPTRSGPSSDENHHGPGHSGRG